METYEDPLAQQAARWHRARESGNSRAQRAAMLQGMRLAAKQASLEYPRTASEIWNESLGRVVI